MKRFIRKMIYRLPKKIAHKVLFYSQMHRIIDFNNVNDLNEKIQYLIVFKYGENESKLSDKILVRDFIIERGYESILTKLYGVYDNTDEIDISKLPEKFVLKTNHGCGGVCICNNKKNFDIESSKKVIKKSLKENYASFWCEYHYGNIHPRIMCEEYLDDGSGVNPIDYKFFCFDGKFECVLVCSSREKKLKRTYFDRNWNRLNYTEDFVEKDEKIKKPKNYEQMITIAEDLSKGFPMVRVDLYNVDGRIYFGEMTFSPSAGLNKTITDEASKYLGSLVKI